MFAAIVVASCDDSFSPVDPGELKFSVFGYLDASADTQWIRLTPIRPLVLTEPGPLAATVTLENVGTGRVFELRDSVFRFSVNPDVGSEGAYLHNFWTTEEIEPGAVYRFSATRDGEGSAESLVSIPSEYQVEVWLGQGQRYSDVLHLVGLKHVAFARITDYYDTCGPEVVREVLDTRSTDSEILAIPINSRFRSREGCGSPNIEKRELLVVGSGAAWPKGLEHSASALGVPDTPSNVSNSVGFLGGVLTRRIPYESCHIDSFRGPSHCRLRYDEESAMLSGTVMDVECGVPVARAAVRLREINPPSPDERKIRETLSRRSGEYEIGALEGGRRYALSVRRLTSDGFDEFQEYTDTLEFAAGEHVSYDVDLRPLSPC